jgi:uncharacterized protein YndB with AHSA1/START domain
MSITVQTTIKAPVEKTWEYYTGPEHIMQWNHATDDWYCPKAENNLVVGGDFSSTMAAKDGSFSFQFGGIYDRIETNKLISYSMADGRHVEVKFDENNGATTVTTIFDPEQENPEEMQRTGWQMILDNFKKYTEGNSH